MRVSDASVKTYLTTLNVESITAPEFIDITDRVSECVDRAGVQSGFAVVYSKHTTAAIAIQENEPLLIDQDLI